MAGLPPTGWASRVGEVSFSPEEVFLLDADGRDCKQLDTGLPTLHSPQV